MTFGQKLRKARGNKPQISLAEELSISPNTLSAYEKDRTLPPLETFKQLCLILNVSADDLLSITDNSNNPRNKGQGLHQSLASLRENLNMSQDQIATLVDVSVSTWSKYETGNRTPPLKRFQIICQKCNVSADYLLGLSNRKGA